MVSSHQPNNYCKLVFILMLIRYLVLCHTCDRFTHYVRLQDIKSYDVYLKLAPNFTYVVFNLIARLSL